MKKAKALENISVRYFAVHLNRSHDPKKKTPPRGVFSFLLAWCGSRHAMSGYEADERSLVGERADRRRWRKQEGERVAAVEKIKESESPKIFSGTATGQANAMRL